MKVLIADPDWRFAQQATSYLESRADLTMHQTEAASVLEHVRRWQPDVIMVAAELAQGDLLRELQQLRPRPAILLTGWMDRYDLAWRAWQKGGDDVFIKPLLRIEDIRDGIVTAMENAALGNRHRRTCLAASA